MSAIVPMDMAMMQQNHSATIPEFEESPLAPHYYEGAGYEYEEEYILDLGSGLAESACPTPTPSYFKRPSQSPPSTNPRRRSGQRDKEAERDCGICFEPATSPIRTRCCSHLFCAEHIAQWLLGPAADGRCPGCRAPCSFAFGEDTLSDKGLLALGHPSLLLMVPRTPPPSRSPSPSLSSYSSSSSYASYPTSPASPSSSELGSPTSSESEEEDSTDYSLPALLRARALQTRRHTSHPFSSVLGARAATVRVLCVAGWLVVVAVLAGSGRWT
ncbi:hypothetical protein C8R44DRAFT_772014 [Mycena epipterygia]|nr:hypothetical protein C8R44DRAFT_772014 [Mycena epipterygia]